MMVVVCQKCRCSNQFGTLFCRNCGEKLKIVDQNHPDFSTGKAIKRIIGRIINLAIVLCLLGLLGALFVPIGLPVEKEITAEDIKKARADCEAIDNALKTGKGSVIFTFTPERASWGLNYMLDEKRPMPPVPSAASSSGSNYARPSSAPPSAVTPNAPMQSHGGGLIKFGAGASSSGRATTLAAITPPPPPPPQASQPQAVQAVEATPEAGVWKGHTNPGTRRSEDLPKAEPIFTSKYVVDVNKDRSTSVILTGKMLYYIPYRLELIGELKDSEPDKSGDTKPEFELKSTKFGHVTFPSFLKNQGLELFKQMTSDKKLKAYAGRIKAVKVESEAIQITVNR
ncbi:MAG: hypothetical protein WCV67_11825 [Victivallaceae bacterium]|jgi:hypothetical protein